MTKQLSTVLLGLLGTASASAVSCTDSALDDATALPQEATTKADATCAPASLRTDLAWYGQNRETIGGWLAEVGCRSDGFKAKKAPVALFDWDNTVVKNDVGDAITFHLISHDKVVQPPNQDWHATSRYMTDAAAAALTAACGTDVPEGQPLPTSTNLACADEMLSIYIDGKTRGGAAAFAGWNYRRMEPTYAWTAQLLAGYTHAEVEQMALDAVLPMLAAPQGTTQVVGTKTLNGWVRIYDQVADLIHVAQTEGLDVWVITASPQDVVRALAPLTGIAADHVVGIRSLTDSAGKLTYQFEGCGPIADGDSSMISYIEGKRCWVNKAIFGDTTAKAIERREPEKRQVFAAGDSDTDIEFVRDAKYKLVLNRNKKELMCFAYNNQYDSWRINPMFIEPKSALSSLYPCSTTACKDANGVGRPCLDEDGNVIPDQADTVHP
ncbi:MAG TPA: HAD family hydrolase [Kofleriaceae bacterium]|nr:HAD family hydrolase [Kofleriaceae bacterium]